MNYDFLIKGGTVVDGSGEPAYKGSVAVKDEKIEAVLKSEADSKAVEENSREVVDAGGFTVCPGFIDMHSHADWILPLKEHPEILSPLVEQGITTVIGGNCGYSPAPLVPESLHNELVNLTSEFLAERPISFEWGTMGAFLDHLEGKGLALNLAMLAGHGALRFSMFGHNYDYPGKEGLSAMVNLMEKALEDGAYGISLGLGYAPGIFSEIRELEEFAALAQSFGRLLTVHLKAYTRLSGAYPLKLFGGEPHNLQALREALDMARRTGVKMQISHLLFVGTKTWPTAERGLQMIEEAAADLDIAFDSFPHTCGNTTVYIIYPTWFLNNIEHNFKNKAARRRLKLEVAFITRLLGFGLEDIQLLSGGHPEADRYNGMFFSEIARHMGSSVFDAYLKISELSSGKALCLMHKYNGAPGDEAVLHRVASHPLNLFETDAIIRKKGLQNPAAFGAFPRVIEHFHKNLGLLTLEETVHKMTAGSARRFGIEDRGEIKKGYFADLTLIDYNEVRDNTSPADLERRPSGIKRVYINGSEVVRNGKAVPRPLAGRVLRAR